MILSQEIVDDVLIEYRRTRSPFRTANNTGLDASVVWGIIEKNADKLSTYPERHDGRGRPEMLKYLVARRRVSSRSWDNEDEDVLKARSAYEAGTHEMATGRDGGWMLLYLIPRRKTHPRANYFKPESF